MFSSIAALNSNGASARGSSIPDVDLSKLRGATEKPKPVKAAPDAEIPGPRIAMGSGRVGLTPDQVKAFAVSYLSTAQRLVDTTYRKYIKSAPNLQLKFWTRDQLKASGKSNPDSVLAFVYNKDPSTVNVAYQNPIFKNNKIDANDSKSILVHEVLHTRSADFDYKIHWSYSEPLAVFSDGSLVRNIKEGFTEVFTMQVLKIKATTSIYDRETKWAVRVMQKVGIETAKKAYFGADAASMDRVKKAINELVAEDKRNPMESESDAFSIKAPSTARSPSIESRRRV
jgi:hypothetical protein